MYRYLALVGLTLVTPAQAADWVHVGANATQNYYLDSETAVLSTPTTTAKAWIKISNVLRASSANYKVQHWEFDCEAHTMRTVANVRYRADGTPVSSETSEYDEFAEIIPESVGKRVEQLICFQPRR